MMLSGLVIAITGGTSGIGLAIVQQCVREGASVAILARDLEKLDRVKQHLNGAVFTYAGDVGCVQDIVDFYQAVEQAFGKLDVVIANAGIAQSGSSLEDVSETEFDALVQTNVKGLFFTVQKALPYLKEGANVILISSVAGIMGIPGHSIYGATKAAVNYLTSAFSVELLRSRNIRINTISPGYTLTEGFLDLAQEDPETFRTKTEKIPLGRFCEPTEIAQTVLFLISGKNNSICGANLIVDGGISIVDHHL